MENLKLKKLIWDFRKGEIYSFSIIYDVFKKLINFYSKKAGDEDVEQELMIFLMELLYDIDLSRFEDNEKDNLKRYIAVALGHKYINIIKEIQNSQNKFYELLECDFFHYDNTESDIYVKSMLENLSPRQRMIIVYKYIYNYSDVEISYILGISRQAVNRLKNRALGTLRKLYF